MSTAGATVYVVDDEEPVGDSIAMLLRTVGLATRVYRDPRTFLEEYRPELPGCLLLDVRMPQMGGLEVQRELVRRNVTLPVIFITGHGDVPMTVQAMKAGAVEFLTKPFNDAVLLDAIRGAIERSRAALHEESEMQALRSAYASLTPREREVMALVVSGLLNKQVGGELGISEITVKAHRGQMMRKMKADSLAALVTMASRLGLRTAPTVSH